MTNTNPTPTQQGETLEPCPNTECGSSKVVASNDFSNYYVYCAECFLRGPRESTETFGARWNNLPRTNTRAAVAGPRGDEDDAPIRREVRSSRHPHFTAEDHERMRATLDSLSDYPTEEEAEAALQACGTSGKEVVNEFIERLLKENLELKRKLAAAASSPTPAESDADALVDEVQYRMDQVVEVAVEWHQSDENWAEAADKLANAINSLLELRGEPQTAMPRRWCSVHNREEFKYESLEHELHAAAPPESTQDVKDAIIDWAIGCRNCGDTWERSVSADGIVAPCEDCGDDSYNLAAPATPPSELQKLRQAIGWICDAADAAYIEDSDNKRIHEIFNIAAQAAGLTRRLPNEHGRYDEASIV